MNLINSILACGVVCGMALSSIGVANADEETSKSNGVIFRVENIKPIENEEGLTTQCEFFVTVYNRMDKEIKEAELNLAWTDSISAKYEVTDGNVEVVKDGEKAKTIVSTMVELKEIAPHQQKSFKKVVDTNKCFLLFDRVNYNVPLCVAEGDEIKIRNNKRMNDGSCTNVFDYVNSQNPEYYSEFKDIPESDLEKIAEDQKRQDVEALEEIHKQSLETIEKIADILNNVK